MGGKTPRKWSLCQYVVNSTAPLIISDATRHPAFAEHPLVKMGVMRSYAGYPVRAAELTLGTVCVISPKPHSFSSVELTCLRLAAQSVEARLGEGKDSSFIELSPSDIVSNKSSVVKTPASPPPLRQNTPVPPPFPLEGTPAPPPFSSHAFSATDSSRSK